jgi:hypothetical protein
MHKLNLLFFLISLYCLNVSFAQTPADTGSAEEIKVPTVIRYISMESVLNNDFRMAALDTLLNDIEIVQPNVKYFYNNLSNNGSATNPQLFSLNTPVLTTFGNHSYDLYNMQPNQIRFYKTNKRFSELTYHLSGGKENQVKLTMAQNIFSNWNVGFDFKRLGSLGFLNDGTTFNSNFDAFTWLHSKNKRYNLFASALWNSIRNKVNGGLVTDSLFESEPVANNELSGLAVFLTDATQKYRNHVFSFLHYYTFGHKKQVNDSTRSFVPLFRIQTSTEYESGNFIYKDATDNFDFYRHNYFSDQTSDSLHWDSFINKFTLSSAPQSLAVNTFRTVNFEVSAGQQLFHYLQLDLDSTKESRFAEAGLFGARDEKKIDYTLKAKYVFEGEHKEDYSVNADVRIPMNIFGNLYADASQARFMPSFIQTVYRSNHFAWSNKFFPSEALSYGLKYELPKYHFSLGAKQYSITEYIFYNEESMPEQYTGTIQIQQAFINKNFHIGWWRLNNTVFYQQSDNVVIPLPEIASHHSLYYESWLFKKKLFAQVGIDVHYTTEYFAPSYNPAVNIFHLQHERKTNGYVLADLFFNFKVKTARVFIKLHNAADDLIQTGYFLTPHYPMPGRMFQFGLNWRFFD